MLVCEPTSWLARSHNFAALNEAEQIGGNVGPNLGFSDGIGGYGGGLSFQYTNSYPSSTLMDMNGDGRPDSVSHSGDTIMVPQFLNSFLYSVILLRLQLIWVVISLLL